jgi:hypothetical protein
MYPKAIIKLFDLPPPWLKIDYFTAPSALSMPAPKKEVCPIPPVHRRGSAEGQPTGQANGVAEERSNAATAP